MGGPDEPGHAALLSEYAGDGVSGSPVPELLQVHRVRSGDANPAHLFFPIWGSEYQIISFIYGPLVLLVLVGRWYLSGIQDQALAHKYNMDMWVGVERDRVLLVWSERGRTVSPFLA